MKNNFSLPEGWRYESLLSLVDVIGGISYSPEDITSEGVRIIRGGNIQDNVVELKEDDVFLPINYKNQNNSLKVGDIVLVASTGSVDALGRTATIWENMPNVQIGAFLRILRPKKEKLAPYISLWLSSQHYLKYIRQVAKGTSINNIGHTHLKNFLIPIPSDEEISKISKIYTSCWRKINLNRSTNKELEEMAKEIYDYWFVQFDFPDENGRPYKSSGGKMVYNETLKREVPEGWEVKKCSDIVNIITGKEDANFSTPNGVYPFFTCSKDILRCDITAFEGSAVLIAGNGDFNVKHFTGKFNAYQRTYVLIPELKYYSTLYFAIYERINSFKSKSNGSIVKFITKGDIENVTLLDCHSDSIYNQLNNLIFEIESIDNEIAQLTKLRDQILPLLMTGQVSIK